MHFNKSILALSTLYASVQANPSFRAARMGDGKSDDMEKPEMNTYKFKWDAANAAGVKGEIWMQYEKNATNPLHATYTVDLDLNEVNLGAIQEAFPDCDYSNIQLTWQLQTTWDDENTSGALVFVPWRRLVVLLIQLMLVVQCLNTMEEQPVMLKLML